MGILYDTKRLGHEIDENGTKPNEEKREAILQLKPPSNTKELQSFLDAIQYLPKFSPKFSKKTDRLRKLLKKIEPLICEKGQDDDFMQIKRMLTKKPCLGHYAKDKKKLGHNRRK